MECVGVDDASWETVVSFSIIVKGNIVSILTSTQLVIISAKNVGIQGIILALLAKRNITFTTSNALKPALMGTMRILQLTCVLSAIRLARYVLEMIAIHSARDVHQGTSI